MPDLFDLRGSTSADVDLVASLALDLVRGRLVAAIIHPGPFGDRSPLARVRGGARPPSSLHESPRASSSPPFHPSSMIRVTMRGEEDIIQSKPSAESRSGGKIPLDVVERGRPVAQRYGIEGGWVGKFDVAKLI